MGSIPHELSLDCRQTHILRTISEFLGEVSMIGTTRERVLKIDEYVRRLEDELKKIDAFKRELPLCMLLLNDAIMVVKEEAKQLKKSNAEPVLEEFIPLKKSDDDEDAKAEIKKDKDTRDKMNWMSSVQLWNTDHYSSSNDMPEARRSTIANTKMRASDEGKCNMLDDQLQYSTGRNLGREILPFNGYPGFPLTLRKEGKEELAGVGGLSLRTPEIKHPKGDLGSRGFCSNSSSSRVSSSSAASGQSNLKNGSQLQQLASRKQRRCWSPELHRRFVNALQQLGGSQAATPKQIRELMQVDGLTNDEVKSHLQKYRLHTRRLPSSQNTSVGNQSVVVLGGLWTSQDNSVESSKQSKQSNSQSGSPEGPLQLAGNSLGTFTTGGDSMEEEDEKSESHSSKSHANTTLTIDV